MKNELLNRLKSGFNFLILLVFLTGCLNDDQPTYDIRYPNASEFLFVIDNEGNGLISSYSFPQKILNERYIELPRREDGGHFNRINDIEITENKLYILREDLPILDIYNLQSMELEASVTHAFEKSYSPFSLFEIIGDVLVISNYDWEDQIPYLTVLDRMNLQIIDSIPLSQFTQPASALKAVNDKLFLSLYPTGDRNSILSFNMSSLDKYIEIETDVLVKQFVLTKGDNLYAIGHGQYYLIDSGLNEIINSGRFYGRSSQSQFVAHDTTNNIFYQATPHDVFTTYAVSLTKHYIDQDSVVNLISGFHSFSYIYFDNLNRVLIAGPGSPIKMAVFDTEGILLDEFELPAFPTMIAQKK